MGVEQVSRTFDKIGKGVTDLRKPFNEISKTYYKSEQIKFKNEGAYRGEKKWTKLSDSYAKWKKGRGQILVLRGHLKRAATTRNASGSIFDLGRQSLTMGVDLQVNGWNLAALHQFGTRKMPKREIIRIDAIQKKKWMRIIRDYIHKLTVKK